MEEITPSVNVTTTEDNAPYHAYLLQRDFPDYQFLPMSQTQYLYIGAQGLLDIAGYVERNRARIEQEADEDRARQERAMRSEASDMESIRREWRDYRNEGLGPRG